MLQTRVEIEGWLFKHNIMEYSIDEDLSVDVFQDVDIQYCGLNEIPVQFRYVEGSFNCSGNQLTSLKGCPRVVTEDFCCNKNSLVSLENCPSSVGGVFLAFENPIKSLKGITHVERIINLSDTEINTIDLEDIPPQSKSLIIVSHLDNEYKIPGLEDYYNEFNKIKITRKELCATLLAQKLESELTPQQTKPKYNKI